MLKTPDQQKEMAQRIIQEGWSVKRTEQEVNKVLERAPARSQFVLFRSQLFKEFGDFFVVGVDFQYPGPEFAGARMVI
jgi:hypothetical protein